MTWKNFVSPLAITSRRRVVASAVVYGLSLAVRFTSAAGEEVEIPPQSAQRAHPLISIMTRDGARLPYQDWGHKPAQPIVFRQGWPPGSAAMPAASPLNDRRFRFTPSRRRRPQVLPHTELRRRQRAVPEKFKPQENHMRLVIIGAGFAGMYAALSAARLRDIQGVSPDELEIALVAPEPTLVVRPRLYEPKPETLTAPLLDVLKAIDVVYVQGSAETVDTKSRMVQIATGKARASRSPTTGWSWPPAAGCSVPIFPALPSTASASTRSTMRLPSTSTCMASPIGRP